MGEFVRYARDRLSERCEELALAWLDAIAERLPEDPHRLFPTRTLLNRVPELLRRIAARLDGSSDDGSDPVMMREIHGLVELRRTQGYELAELSAELELLGSLFFDALDEELRRYPGEADPLEVLRVSRRMYASFARLARFAANAYGELRADDRRERARLLRAYAHSIEHDLRNRANAAGLQLQLAREAAETGDLSAARPSLEAAERALRHLTTAGFDSLTTSALQRRRAPEEARRQRLDELVRELGADLDGYARHHGVRVRVDSALPTFPVDAGRVQLALAYLIGSAIRFADPSRHDAAIRIRGARCGDVGRIEIEHIGLGISPGLQESILGATGVVSATGESPGLGLLLAREALAQVGGRMRHVSLGGPPRFVVEIPQPPPELVTGGGESDAGPHPLPARADEETREHVESERR